MPRRPDFIDLLIETSNEKKRIVENLDKILIEIKHIVLEFDREAKVIHFGSSYKGNMRPDSDIDILIISNKAIEKEFIYRLKKEIYNRIGGEGVIELHIIPEKTYKMWYEKFIKNRKRTI